MHSQTKSRYSRSVAAGTLVCLEGLVVLQGWLAYSDQFLTVSQMQARGVAQGLPFVWHFGMWGDLLVISPIAAYIAGRYAMSWRLRNTLISIAVGLLAAILLSWLFTRSDVPEAHVQNHQLTLTGLTHGFYMAIAFAVFTQFFIFTRNISDLLLRLVSAFLLIHVFIGTHMILGILKEAHWINWYPGQPLESKTGYRRVLPNVVNCMW